MSASKKIMQQMKIISEKADLKKVFAPTAVAAVCHKLNPKIHMFLRIMIIFNL